MTRLRLWQTCFVKFVLARVFAPIACCNSYVTLFSSFALQTCRTVVNWQGSLNLVAERREMVTTCTSTLRSSTLKCQIGLDFEFSPQDVQARH